MFHPLSEKNKFGYYCVGDIRTYKKFEAIELSSKIGMPVEWNFNNESFELQDWTVEPKESITEIYRQRAQQIRDNYDYVVLMFSGGSDSTAMLKSFFDNGIHVDEICSVHEYEGTKNRDWYLTGEILNSAVPFVEKLTASGINVKYRLVDSSKKQYDTVANMTDDQREESYYKFNNVHNLGNLSRLDVRSHVEDYQRIIDSGRRLCLVWGEAKPLVEFDLKYGKHKFVFQEESYDMICSPDVQDKDHPGYFDEMFYHTRDLPSLLIKQGHLCMKHLKDVASRPMMANVSKIPRYVKSSHFLGFEMHNPLIGPAFTVINNDLWCLTMDYLNQVLYPHSVPIVYNQGKSTNKLIHPRDEWLRKAVQGQANRWYMGYIDKVSKFDDAWKKYHKNLTYGIRRLRKEYFLE